VAVVGRTGRDPGPAAAGNPRMPALSAPRFHHGRLRHAERPGGDNPPPRLHQARTSHDRWAHIGADQAHWL